MPLDEPVEDVNTQTSADLDPAFVGGEGLSDIDAEIAEAEAALKAEQEAGPSAEEIAAQEAEAAAAEERARKAEEEAAAAAAKEDDDKEKAAAADKTDNKTDDDPEKTDDEPAPETDDKTNDDPEASTEADDKTDDKPEREKFIPRERFDAVTRRRDAARAALGAAAPDSGYGRRLNRIVGIVTYDDALDILEEEDTEDAELMAGVTQDADIVAYAMEDAADGALMWVLFNGIHGFGHKSSA